MGVVAVMMNYMHITISYYRIFQYSCVCAYILYFQIQTISVYHVHLDDQFFCRYITYVKICNSRCLNRCCHYICIHIMLQVDTIW